MFNKYGTFFVYYNLFMAQFHVRSPIRVCSEDLHPVWVLCVKPRERHEYFTVEKKRKWVVKAGSFLDGYVPSARFKGVKKSI